MIHRGHFSRPVSEAEMVAHMRASKVFQLEHALPDAIGLVDTDHADPLQLLDVIRRRSSDGRFPRSRTTLRWPKGFDRASYRMLTSLDSIDQLGYRLLNAPFAEALSTARLAPSVVAHRFEVTNGAWRSVGVRDGWRHRQSALLKRFERTPDAWLATLDVKNYYPSLTDGVLRSALNSFGFDSWQIDPALAFRGAFDDFPGGTKGVPVGPEASAVLGTVGLVSVDRLLAGIDHFRLVDDVWLVASSESEATLAADAFGSHLELLELTENVGKRRIVSGQDALDVITDPEIDYLAMGGAEISPAAAFALLMSGIAERKLSRVRFGLGALRRSGSLLAVPTILSQLDLIDAEPAAIGRYLRSLMPRLSNVQRGVLVEHVCESVDDHCVAGRIHVTHALGSAALSEDHRATLMDVAAALDDRQHQPLRTHMAAAACKGHRSQGRLRKAMDLAEALDNIDLRRCVAHLYRDAGGRRGTAVLRHLARVDPELRPFLPSSG